MGCNCNSLDLDEAVVAIHTGRCLIEPTTFDCQAEGGQTFDRGHYGGISSAS